MNLNENSSKQKETQKLQLVHLFILLIILITILFFWGELPTLSWKKKINDAKFNAYFASIGAIATAYSLFLIYKQIKLSYEQLQLAKNAYNSEFAPNVKLQDSYRFQLISDQSETAEMPGQYSIPFPVEKVANNVQNIMTLTNWGNGVAHNVNLKANFIEFGYGLLKSAPSNQTVLKNLIDKHDEYTKYDILNIIYGLSKNYPIIKSAQVISEERFFKAINYLAHYPFYHKLLSITGLITIENGFNLTLEFFDSNNKRFQRVYNVIGAFHQPTTFPETIELFLKLEEISFIQDENNE